MIVPVLAFDIRMRLIRLAGMMGSVHQGERDAAITKCNELLLANGLTWAEALSPTASPPPPPPIPRSWRAVAEELMIFHAGGLRLTGKSDEQQFLHNLCDRGGAPTLRQSRWLADIAQRCGVALWDGYRP